MDLIHMFDCKLNIIVDIEGTVQRNLAVEINKNYPTVRVMVDCTELEIEKPSNAQAQQDTRSTYKNTNTMKVTKNFKLFCAIL